MSDELLLRHCSPTVIGLKTANMFVCRFDSREQEHSTLQKLNKKLCSKGLRIIPLRHNEDKVLLYLYRPSKLKRDLKDAQADRLLQSCGYSCGNTNLCIVQLIKRLGENKEFPHEIGLFLGYPALHRALLFACGKGCQYRKAGSLLLNSFSLYGL